MIAIVQVRLTSHFLGELKPDHRGVRRFRMWQNKVAVNQNAWLDDLNFAARTLKLPVKVAGRVEPPAGIVPASIHLHKRTFSGAHVEFFEAFVRNTVLSFEMVLHDQMPKCPSLDQLADLLRVVGEFRGISQWGNKFGLGRFSVLLVRDRFPSSSAATPDVETTGEPDLESARDLNASACPAELREPSGKSNPEIPDESRDES